MMLRLVRLAQSRWLEFDGWCVTLGVDPLELRLDRFVHLVYFWLVRNLDGDARARVDEQLDRPPEGATAEQAGGVWSRESELAAFRTLRTS